jgi:hypothetical protein
MQFNQQFADQLAGSTVDISNEQDDYHVRGHVESVQLADETFTIRLVGLSQPQYPDSTDQGAQGYIRSTRVYVPTLSSIYFCLRGNQETIFFYPEPGQNFQDTAGDRALKRNRR